MIVATKFNGYADYIEKIQYHNGILEEVFDGDLPSCHTIDNQIIEEHLGVLKIVSEEIYKARKGELIKLITKSIVDDKSWCIDFFEYN